MTDYIEPEKRIITLRPHQERAIELLFESIRTGHKHAMLGAPCSFGKTVVAAALLKSAAEKGKRGIIICDRIKQVEQTLVDFDSFGLDVGVLQNNHKRTRFGAQVQIASMQTLASRKRIPEFEICVVDEAHIHYKTLTKIMTAYNAIPRPRR